MTHRLPLAALAGVVLFTVSWLVLGFVSPGYHLFDIVVEPYSALAQPISGLGLGVTGPFMNTAFVVSGTLLALGAAGIGRWWPAARGRVATSILLGLGGAGMAICGLFTFESVMMHLVGFLLAIGAPSIGFLVAGVSLRRTWPRFSAWLYVASALGIGGLVLFQLIFDPYRAGENAGFAGLEQRIVATIVIGTIAALGWVVSRHQPVDSGNSEAGA
jgi:hypothetical protein